MDAQTYSVNGWLFVESATGVGTVYFPAADGGAGFLCSCFGEDGDSFTKEEALEHFAKFAPPERRRA